MPETSYQKTDGDKLIIIAFDIPEKLRRKRNWIRKVLVGLDFKMIQKSVWQGTTKIPEDFLQDLNDLKIIDFIEIFQISKKGSLEKINPK